MREVERGRIRHFNSAQFVDQRGIGPRYDKTHPVMFGEYVPLQPLFTLGGRFAAKLVQEVSDGLAAEPDADPDDDGGDAERGDAELAEMLILVAGGARGADPLQPDRRAAAGRRRAG